MGAQRRRRAGRLPVGAPGRHEQAQGKCPEGEPARRRLLRPVHVPPVHPEVATDGCVCGSAQGPAPDQPGASNALLASVERIGRVGNVSPDLPRKSQLPGSNSSGGCDAGWAHARVDFGEIGDEPDLVGPGWIVYEAAQGQAAGKVPAQIAQNREAQPVVDELLEDLARNDRIWRGQRQ